MPFENRARFIATLAAPLALVGLMVMASALTRNGPKEFADKVIMADDKAPDMQAAFAKARKTLDTFLQTAANPPGDARHFALKVAVIEGNTGEWFWVNQFRRQGDKFSGILSNKPQLVRNVREGQRITFDRSEIGDWMYLHEGKIRGNYTGCVLKAKATPEELKEWELFPPLVCD